MSAPLIAALAAEWNRSIPSEDIGRLNVYLELLLAWNAKINLTGARSADELIGEHFPDAFALAEVVPPSARVIDVGSGGGLPALPFGILRRDCAVTMVEPRAKRVAFLRTAARDVGLEARIEPTRIEAFPGAGAFDVACSKATFTPEAWVALGARLVRPAGQVVVFGAEPPPAVPAGLELVATRAYSAAAGRRRVLYVYVPRGT